MFIIIAVVVTIVRFIAFMYDCKSQQDNTQQEMLQYESCGNYMLWELK